MTKTKTRRRTFNGRFAPAPAAPLAAPPAAPPAVPLFDQEAAETLPPPAASVPPEADELDLAERAARLADVDGDAAFRARKRELALAALADKAELAAAERARAAELAAARAAAELAEIEAASAARRWQEVGKRWRKRAVTSALRIRRLAVNLGVTGAAVFGQWEYLKAKTNLGENGALLVSVLVELLAVAVLDYAHRRRQARRSSWHLYLTAAGMAASVGTMNYAHWSESDLALVGALFFLFSLAGPLLWSLSVIESEEPLAADNGKPAARRSARFPLEQWALFLPTTIRAKRLAVRHQITDPHAALDLLAERTAERAAARAARRAGRGKHGLPAAPPVVADAPPAAPAPPAVDDQPAPPPTVDDQPADPPTVDDQPAPPPAYVLDVPLTADQIAAMKTEAPRELQAAARATARKAIAAGARPTGRDLGDAYGMSDRWGRDRLAEVDKITTAA